MMKLAALAFLFSLTAQADNNLPTPAAGTYRYTGEFSVRMKIHHVAVHVFTDANRAELEKLRNSGYECWHKIHKSWLCRKFQPSDGAADIVRGRVMDRLGDATLTLGELFGEPSLISKGTDVAQYRVTQSASYGGQAWKDYRLVSTRAGWSIRMGEPTEVQFSFDNGALSKQEQIAVTESENAYSLYVVMAEFR